MYTYVQQPVCKKENTATYVYMWAGSRTPTRAYVRRGLVYMAGLERRNIVVVVFMGRNGMRGCVHREGLDGTDAFHSDPAGWLPMNTITRPFLCSDPAMYTSPGHTYA